MDQQILANAEPIPGYRLIERLGRGGYGEVWKAEAPGGMHKAIKFVAGDVDGFGDDKAAEQEYKSLNRVKTIRHPFILSIERFEVIDRQLVIVMELADRNLWDRFSECQKHGMPGIPRSELLRYMDEAAEALDLMNLHHQIQHLDVKPHNIFLVHQHVKVADFGLAKDLEGTQTNLTGGITPTYAPPETFEGWVSRQSDQYSLAIVFMEMLTGRRPFMGTNTRQLVMQHLTAVPDLAALAPADRGPIGRSLSKKPDDRFATCADLVRALRGEEPPARPTPRHTVEPAIQRAKSSSDTDVPGGPTQLAPRTERRASPALVTPASRHTISAASLQLRRPSPTTGTVTKSVAPPVERTGQGVLVPALIVGVGGIGLTFLRALRQLIADKYGKSTLPHFRWLHIDTDPAAAEAATEAPAGVALTAQDILIAPLRRPTHYLTVENQPSVESWLPREELFQIPRTPATSGIRGLGRLALCDHYHLICHRIRTALEPFLAASPMDEADRTTKLGLRSSFPRVYLATSLTGGTGSGMFLDLAYLIRREIQRLGFGKPNIVGLLGVPTHCAEVADPTGMQNARYALTELHHYGSGKSGFQAQFDLREGRVTDPDRPFRRTVLVPIGRRHSLERVKLAADAAAHVAFAELLTPVGHATQHDLSETPDGQSTLIGIRRLVWPRAEVLQAAGWEMARKTLESWGAKQASAASPAAVAAAESLWSERQFKRSAINAALDEHSTKMLGTPPEELIARSLKTLEEPLAAGKSEIQRARDALMRLIELLGRPGAQESEHPNEVGRALGAAAREWAAQGDARLSGALVALVEQPGLRVAGAEDAVRLLRARVAEDLARTVRDAAALEEQAYSEYVPLHNQLLTSQGELASKGPRANLEFGSQLQHWATTRLQALRERASASVIRVWLGNLPEYLRELTGIRNQFAAFVAQLDSTRPTVATAFGICRSIFPNGAKTVGDAAAQILTGITPVDVREFENDLQARVRHHFRGLSAICSRPGDTGPAFLSMLTERATLFFGTRTPQLTASQVLATQANGTEGMHEQIVEMVAASSPFALDAERSPSANLVVMAAPANEIESCLSDNVRSLCPGIEFRKACSNDDVILYQEASAIDLASLPHLTATPPASQGRTPNSHARTDIRWEQVGSI